MSKTAARSSVLVFFVNGKKVKPVFKNTPPKSELISVLSCIYVNF